MCRFYWSVFFYYVAVCFLVFVFCIGCVCFMSFTFFVLVYCMWGLFDSVIMVLGFCVSSLFSLILCLFYSLSVYLILFLDPFNYLRTNFCVWLFTGSCPSFAEQFPLFFLMPSIILFKNSPRERTLHSLYELNTPQKLVCSRL